MRRRHRRKQTTPELDITAFLNLMIVLVPVLLLSMVFTQTRAIGLNFSDEQASLEANNDEPLKLRVILNEGAFLVESNHEGALATVPAGSDGPDYKGLTDALKRIKYSHPDKRDIALLVKPDTDYQTLVSAMDAVRSYPAVVAADVVKAELFPDIALGDAPAGAGQGLTEPGRGDNE